MTNTLIIGRIYLGSCFWANKNLTWSDMATKGRKGSRIRRLRDPMSSRKTFVIQSTTACKDLLMHQCELFVLNSSWRTKPWWRWLVFYWLVIYSCSMMFFHCPWISWAWNFISDDAFYFKQKHPTFESHEPISVQHEETTEILLALSLNSFTNVYSLVALWFSLGSVKEFSQCLCLFG